MIAGVGGQGILFTSKIIGEAALESNMDVLTSEIHGMAQRGGAVVSTVKIGNTSSPFIADGEADIVIAFEPVEALRTINKISKNTTVIINANPVIPFPVTLGKEKYQKIEQILSEIKKRCKNLLTVDANRLAQHAGSGITMNTVMIGAFSHFSVLSKEKIKETIRKNVSKKYIHVNMRAFELGRRAVKHDSSMQNRECKLKNAK
ncbi:MAG: indolepyruvate ferredoxin oxidoreductase subunit beta [Thermoplasmatales archaeon]|nr:indolepyruvate ferredoxin oxidoreductase subunit beta [Thermoplasmatales archaeon]